MKKRGRWWIILGILFLLTAISLACYNLWDEARAEETTSKVLMELESKIETDEIFQKMYEEFPEKEMPVVKAEEYSYIGILKIPSLGLELPVMEDWSYPKLKISPCRYDGSAYQNNLIISAHNYACHFGNLKSLPQGAYISFTDMDGNVFEYEVVEMEIIQPFGVNEMKDGDWDLTLFTCTYGGQSRVTIRCKLIEKLS